MTKKQTFRFCYLAFMVNGMLAVMTGTILNYLMIEYRLNFSLAGMLISVQSMGNLLAGLCSGFIICKIGRKKTITLFLLLFTIGFGGIAMTASSTLLYIFVAFTGIGWGLCNNIAHILITEKSEGEAYGMTFLHTSYAFGSFVAPILVTRVIALGLSFKVAILFVASCALLLLLWYLYLEGKDKKNKEFVEVKSNVPSIKKEKEILSFSFLKEKRYYICALIYFIYIGIEVCFNSWLITFFTKTNIMSEGMAQTMLSLLWFVIMVARLLNVLLGKYLKRDLLLMIQCIATGVMFGILIYNRNEGAAVILIVLLGIFMAGVAPSSAANTAEYIKGSGIASGIIFAIGGLGSTIIPFAVGRFTQFASIVTGMKMILILFFILMLMSFLNLILLRKEKEINTVT